MVIRTSIKSEMLGRLTSAGVFALLAAGCASGGRSLDAANTDANYKEAIDVYTSPTADTSGLDPVAAAAYWGSQYDRNPDDWRAAVNYSASLRKIGSVDQAVTVITKTAGRHGSEPDVDFEAGKALIEGGRAFEAVRYLEEASAARPRDWKVASAYGVALDQIGEHEAARTKYDYALAIAPGSVVLLNNKGLSFALEGKLSEAVTVLRTAATSPGADARIRQNLALTLAIKGDMFEAERLARSDLPPQIADQNIDYFRSLVVQPAYWQQYASDNTADAPSFDPAPSFAPAPVAAPVSAPAPAPAPLPTLKEEPKDEEPANGQPLALIEVPKAKVEGVTTTSATASTTPAPQFFVDMNDADEPVEVEDEEATDEDADLGPDLKGGDGQ